MYRELLTKTFLSVFIIHVLCDRRHLSIHSKSTCNVYNAYDVSENLTQSTHLSIANWLFMKRIIDSYY